MFIGVGQDERGLKMPRPLVGQVVGNGRDREVGGRLNSKPKGPVECVGADPFGAAHRGAAPT